MGKFCENEKKRQAKSKLQGHFFSEAAREDGVYRTKKRDFCLPLECAAENLYEGIRKQAQAYFNGNEIHGHLKEDKIHWHDGKNGLPSNHLCSSQVCCVNFLFPFVEKGELLKLLLQPVFPDIEAMISFEEGNERFVEFEWIGEKDYLGEGLSRASEERSRGSLFTSADAMVQFRKTDGRKQRVLIEWKYTESYPGRCIAVSKSGTDRRERYRSFFDKGTCKIDKTKGNYEDYFYEPFYQLLRQQLLAQEMEEDREGEADIVSVLHIAPEANGDFKKMTSPELSSRGRTPTEFWQQAVMDDRFKSVSGETLFGNMAEPIVDELKDWVEYIGFRYPWVGLR